MSRFAPETAERIRYLVQPTDGKLFATPLTPAVIESLPENDALAERVDAFVARFGRLQDTLGDKLLPAFMILMEETPGTMIDNLDRAERLGLIESADGWATIRKLCNRMIHDYVKNPSELVDSLSAAHEFIPALQLYADVFDRSYGLSSIGLRYFNELGPRQDPDGAYPAVIRNGPRRFCTAKRSTSTATARPVATVALLRMPGANVLAATTSKESAINQVCKLALSE